MYVKFDFVFSIVLLIGFYYRLNLLSKKKNIDYMNYKFGRRKLQLSIIMQIVFVDIHNKNTASQCV